MHRTKTSIKVLFGFSLVASSSAIAQMSIVGPTIVCPNQQYSYQLQGADPTCTQFAWDVVNGHLDGTDVTIAFITWNVTSAGTVYCTPNCDSIRHRLQVSIQGLPPLPSISKNSPNYEICSAEAWTVTCSSSLGNNYGYDWFVSYSNPPGADAVLLDGSSYTQSNPHHTSGNTTSLTAPSGYGPFFVNVQLNDHQNCPSGYVHFQGQAGVLNSSQFSISGPSMLCSNSTGSYSAYTPYAEGITGYQWSWSNSFNYQNGQGTRYLGVATTSPFNGGSIALQLANRCGSTGSASVLYVSGGSCGYQISASPNPTSGTLQLRTSEGGSDENESSINNPSRPLRKLLNATLLNQFNYVVWSSTVSETICDVDFGAIPDGVYYLKISLGRIT